jgi:hypothetical protein
MSKRELLPPAVRPHYFSHIIDNSAMRTYILRFIENERNNKELGKKYIDSGLETTTA